MDDGRNTSYDAMHLAARLRHFDLKDLEAEVLHLPYASEKFGLIVVLPHRGSTISQVGALEPLASGRGSVWLILS